MNYDKIQLYSKSGDVETNAEAEEGNNALNPIEKILGMMKASTITATISPAGEVKNITGYKEIGDKILASFDPNDLSGQAIAKSQWEKLIGEGLVKKNLDQLFKIFPDSSVHLRDTWKINSEQGGEFGLITKSTFTLKAINSDVAVISVQGKITNSNTSATSTGISGTAVNIQGDQEGEFEMETKTGMLLHCEIAAKAKGTVTTMGQEVPVKINLSLKVDGRKVK